MDLKIRSHCLRKSCRQSVEIADPELYRTPTGTYAVRGRCPRCGGALSQFVKKPQ